MARILLVTGATGKQGGAVIDSLLRSNTDWHIRALTRNPKSPKSAALIKQGVEIVQGDLDDPESLSAALRGVYGVFSVTTNVTKGGVTTEMRHGKNLADAAAESNIEHYVYSSVSGANRSSGVPHFESKYKVEKHIRSLGLPCTILRPVMFMDNFQNAVPRIMVLSLLKTLVADKKAVQMIATRDIGEFAALAFNNKERFLGSVIELAGDTLNRREIVETLKKQNVTGNIAISLPSFILSKMPDDVILMFRWFNDVGYDADISETRATRAGTLDFDGWVKTLKK